jgi:molecular chaperone GrpE
VMEPEQIQETPLTGEELGAMPIVDDPLAVAIAEQDALKDKLLRAHAELENYRKRVQREREEDRRYAAAPFARDLLPVLDNLQRAVDAADKGGTVEDLRQGVRMVLQQANELLGRFQVRPIEAAGKPLDPNYHEAITQMPSDQPPMTVLQEVERGYTLHDRVLRPSKVIVAAPKAE